MENPTKKISLEISKKLVLPFIILFLFIAAFFFYRIKIVPTISVEFHQNLVKYIGSIFVILLSFIIQRIGDGILIWYRKNIAEKTVSNLDDQLIPFLRRFLRVAIWIIALLIILPFYGVNVSALIALLGVSSLAIALAAQDTIANIIAGFLIMVDRPFKIGDSIKIPSGEIVKVLDIGIRRSKFTSEDKAIIIVPNLDLSKSKIVNYTYGEGDKR